MGKHIWGYWDCPYCSTKGIRGDNRKCPYCGIQIPPDTKYYIKQDVHEEVEQSKLDSAAHWICEYCDTQNPAAANYCTNCGSPKEDARRDYFGNGLNGNPSRRPVQTPTPQPQQGSAARDYLDLLKAFVKNYKWSIIFGLLIVFVFWLFKPVTRTATVSGFEWERSIAIEEYQNVDENGWSLPSNANLHTTKQEIHHYDQVLDHYETRTRQVAKQVPDGYDTDYRDLGNGQFEEVQTPRYRTEYETEYYDEPVYRNEPVYRTKYYYDIDKWIKVGSSDSSGSGREPYWKETGLETNISSPACGDRREGARTGKYYAVITTKKGSVQKKECTFDAWQSLTEGQKIKYKSSRFSDKPLE